MKKSQIDNQVANHVLLEPKRVFKIGDDKEYKVKSIIDKILYGYKIENYLLDLYYLVL